MKCTDPAVPSWGLRIDIPARKRSGWAGEGERKSVCGTFVWEFSCGVERNPKLDE